MLRKKEGKRSQIKPWAFTHNCCLPKKIFQLSLLFLFKKNQIITEMICISHINNLKWRTPTQLQREPSQASNPNSWIYSFRFKPVHWIDHTHSRKGFSVCHVRAQFPSKDKAQALTSKALDCSTATKEATMASECTTCIIRTHCMAHNQITMRNKIYNSGYCNYRTTYTSRRLGSLWQISTPWLGILVSSMDDNWNKIKLHIPIKWILVTLEPKIIIIIIILNFNGSNRGGTQFINWISSDEKFQYQLCSIVTRTIDSVKF